MRLGFRIQNVLYLGMGSLIIATGAQLYVLIGIGKHDHRFRKRVKSTGPLGLFSHRYTALMAAFVVMGVAVAVLFHYAFLWVTGSRFPGGIELVSFLGFFSGIMMMLAWIMKRFLFGWIKGRFGIRITLLMSPVFLLVLTIAAAIAGESYGFAGEAHLFTYFFMLVVLSKFVDRSFKECIGGSIHEPDISITGSQGSSQCTIGD